MENVKCNRCGKAYAIRSMTQDLSGKGLVCEECFQIINKVRADADRLIERKIMNVERSTGEKRSAEHARLQREGKEYMCRNCNYKFFTALEVRRCPYCSDENRLTSMNDLVKEIDDIIRSK